MTKHSLNFSITKLASHCLNACAFIILTGCGGGGSSSSGDTPESDVIAPTKVEAFRFLNQATLGATEKDAQLVMKPGYEEWIEQQMQTPPSLQTPYLYERLAIQGDIYHEDRTDIWIQNAIREPDQLRQRVALALSEIMVVSQIGNLTFAALPVANYHDMLAENAFGNYRDLIEKVTLHPTMGVYLSALDNRRSDPENNIRPDENYAREVLQLFSIGLVELNIDGSAKHDSQGLEIPTYTQEIIEGFAQVFTGWFYRKLPDDPEDRELWDERWTVPMEIVRERHDYGPKKLLNGVTLPANQSGEKDLKDALDNIFAHPNVAPFITIRLIQRLVTSNPSPAYITRIATVFNDNGQGVKGDLGAVIKAILLDNEARNPAQAETAGKLKEPLLRVTQLWRAYDAKSSNQTYRFWRLYTATGQGPLQANSVFNFFTPFHAPQGEIKDKDLVAPEFQITTDYLNAIITNFFQRQIFSLHSENPWLTADDVYIDIGEEVELSNDIDALIDRAAEKLLAGQISDSLRTEIRDLIEQTNPDSDILRATLVIFLITSSPEFAYQN